MWKLNRNETWKWKESEKKEFFLHCRPALVDPYLEVGDDDAAQVWSIQTAFKFALNWFIPFVNFTADLLSISVHSAKSNFCIKVVNEWFVAAIVKKF